jgi:hypothetical protein
MFTCFIRYKIEPNQLDEFRAYAHSWISLVRKYGGTHHGYFIPGTAQDNLPSPDFSFPISGPRGRGVLSNAHPYRNRRRLSCAGRVSSLIWESVVPLRCWWPRSLRGLAPD